ncbi:hypothetical protein RN001_005722 [Aquatica leii]|uniref:Uncharacterized protein n=1 Tax=Aquatica leii TaxID=1421715 RepID=A0AAN7SPY2_9COLE|nr:hypothetical protein RN001_005722 [Aquatica leii]
MVLFGNDINKQMSKMLDLARFELVQKGGIDHKVSYMVCNTEQQNMVVAITHSFMAAKKQATSKLWERLYGSSIDYSCNEFDYYFANDEEEIDESALHIHAIQVSSEFLIVVAQSTTAYMIMMYDVANLLRNIITILNVIFILYLPLFTCTA